jgi:accessory gene regulator B
MEKLASKIAGNVASSLNYDNEKEAVIAYGLTALIQIFISVILIFLLGIVFGTPIEALIVCLSASLLRKYSGGAHADTAELCTLISIIYCSLTAVISAKLLVLIYNPAFLMAAIILIYGISVYILYKLAPVDSPNKPIKSEKKVMRMRKGSFLTISVYFIISLALFCLTKRNGIFISCGFSLLFGVSWQIFTLTSWGFAFLGRVNYLYNILRKED